MWSKMIKVKQQLTFLQTNPVHVIIGTPNRVIKLIELSALQTVKLQFVVIDSSYKTVKNFNIFDQYDTQVDLMTLYKNHLQTLIPSNQIKFALF